MLSGEFTFAPIGPSAKTGARLGCLVCGNKPPIETPALLVHTLGGSLPSIPSDLVKDLPVRLALVDLSEVSDLLKVEDPSSFFALSKDTATILFPGSMLSTPLGVVSSKGVMVDTTNGRKEVSVSTLIEAAAKIRPDLTAALSDDPPLGSTRKRVGKALERTSKWLGAHLSAQPATAASPGAEVAGCGVLVGSVVGGVDLVARKHSALDIEGRKEAVPGVVVSGLGLGESPEERAAAVIASLEPLSDKTLRIAVNGFTTLEEV